jgi:hypothetical protein
MRKQNRKMSKVGTRLLAQRRNGGTGGGAGGRFAGPSAHKFVQQFGAARHGALHYSRRHQRLRSTGSRMRGDKNKLKITQVHIFREGNKKTAYSSDSFHKI